MKTSTDLAFFLWPFESHLSLTSNQIISIWIFVVCCISAVALPAAYSAVCAHKCFETFFFFFLLAVDENKN